MASRAMAAASPHLDDAVDKVINGIANTAPQIRTTGGSTQQILMRVTQDFKDFHQDDAEKAILCFVDEYIQVQYTGQNGFKLSNVSKQLQLPDIPKTITRVSGIKVNHVALSDYSKSLNSATLTYRVSVGFDVGKRQEKLYEVDYTLQLNDEYGSAKFLTCENCGAPLKESTGECSFCGTKHIRDTVQNWVITGIQEK